MNSLEKHFIVSDFFLHSWRPYIWLTLIASLPYLQILTFPEFTYYDDHFLIVDNFSHIDKWSNAGHAFLEDVSHQGQGGNLYRPLLTISFIISAKISGTMPFGYHLIDIILHCVSCCLLFIALQMLDYKRSLSFFGTLVFCVHPALVQAIAWIAGRNDSLLAIFILLSFITYIKYYSTSLVRWYFLHLLCFACAMFTKESAIMLPLLVLFYSFSLKKEKIFSLKTVLLFVGWGIVLFNWHILRSASMVIPIGNKLQATTTVISNLWIAVYYFGKIFWPFHLAFAPISTDIHITAGIISGCLLLFALLLSERRNWKYIIFGLMWFFVFLIPTFYYNSGVHTPPKFYEHRIYLSFIGILFVLLTFSYTNRLGYFKRYFPLILFLLYISLGWLSYTHTFNFKNSLTLGEYDASTSPNDPRRYSDITRMNIPKKLNQEIEAKQGRSQPQESNCNLVSKEELWEIIDELKDQLRSNHNDPELYHALAVSYFARGLFLSSEKYFLVASQENPQDATIQYNLGILYYSAQPKMKAVKVWQEALRLDPTMGKVHLNLSYLYYESGQYQLAWVHCQKAMQLGITVPSSLLNEIRGKIS